MFCTGGIRCEIDRPEGRGCEEVYHLQGGILRYLEQVPPAQSLWQGECFVFDERVALGPELTLGTARLAGPPARRGGEEVCACEAGKVQ